MRFLTFMPCLALILLQATEPSLAWNPYGRDAARIRRQIQQSRQQEMKMRLDLQINRLKDRQLLRQIQLERGRLRRLEMTLPPLLVLPVLDPGLFRRAGLRKEASKLDQRDFAGANEAQAEKDIHIWKPPLTNDRHEERFPRERY